MTVSDDRIRVAIVNDFEVIVRGVAEMLSGQPDFELVDTQIGEQPDSPVDVTLFDTFASRTPRSEEFERLVRSENTGRVVVYTWDLNCNRADEVLGAGASGVLSKTLDAEALMDALASVHAGEKIVRPEPEPEPATDEFITRVGSRLTWPGRAEGLTAREAEVLGLIAKGCSNQEISSALYLSINSVKSYIRSAYRKIGAERRSQAVLWALEHGIARSVVRHDLTGTNA